MKRIGIEVLVVAVLVLVVAGVWSWGRHTTAREVAAREQACRGWVDTVAGSEATMVFRAFAAGVHPLVLSGEPQGLDQAVGALLELPGVEFVHVVARDGTVLASSDRKLLTTGRLGSDAAWVLETGELEQRPGAGGVVEMASPVVGPSGPAGFVWMGYDTASVVAQGRPAGWGEEKPAGEAPRPDY